MSLHIGGAPGHLSRRVAVQSLPVPEKDVIAPRSEATLLDLQERFRMADVDGYA
jgi:hypothetical protein